MSLISNIESEIAIGYFSSIAALAARQTPRGCLVLAEQSTRDLASSRDLERVRDQIMSLQRELQASVATLRHEIDMSESRITNTTVGRISAELNLAMFTAFGLISAMMFAFFVFFTR